MKCSCPWCPKPAVPGCKSLIRREPTCEQHSAVTTEKVLGRELCSLFLLSANVNVNKLEN